MAQMTEVRSRHNVCRVQPATIVQQHTTYTQDIFPNILHFCHMLSSKHQTSKASCALLLFDAVFLVRY